MSNKEIKYKDSPETIRNRRINAEFAKMMFRGQSNLEFSKTNQDFKNACEKAGVQPTIRQASKYRRKSGKAYNEGRK